MLVVRGNNPNLNKLDNLMHTTGKKQCAVTIGNFDGVHLGHDKIFDSLFTSANDNNLLKVLITFEPRPVDYFNKLNSKNKVNDRISLLADKLYRLNHLGFDLVWVINFNTATANKSASCFVDLVTSVLKVKHLLIGSDFKFGKNRAGDKGFLQNYSIKAGFDLTVIDDHVINNNRISSTIIRQALLNEQKNTNSVTQYLGRNYGFSGRVLHGQKKGRELGFPTINIHVKSGQLVLPRGVYAVIIIYNNDSYHAMANWGVRPTIADKLELVLEANIFNFDKTIYGEKIYIEFITKIRDEQKFDSLNVLKGQLKLDSIATKQFFSHLN